MIPIVSSVDKSKISKIKYKLNLLPEIGKHAILKGGEYQYANKEISMVSLCTHSDEIDLFLCESLQEIIAYKWNKYARKHHLVGFGFHLLYMLVLILYVNVVYIQNTANMKPSNLEDHEHDV